MFGFLKRLEGDGPTAARQQGDVHALDRAGDPRGGAQDEEYRHADPRDIVEEGVAMSGPGGAPQEGTTAEERRAADRPDDA
jgi:hypothetical protein